MTAPNDVAALVERLTDMSNDTQRAWGPAYIDRAGRDMARAATTIAALQAEVERAKEDERDRLLAAVTKMDGETGAVIYSTSHIAWAKMTKGFLTNEGAMLPAARSASCKESTP